jgi:tRNA pseudouridine38-40 synthase
VYVGKGNYDPAWIGGLLASRDRTRAAPTLDAAGLYLAHVSYDAKWGLPVLARRAWFDEN